MLLEFRAPTRIDLAGGYTDLIPFASISAGAVVNVAIDLHVYVALRDLEKGNNTVDIHYVDHDTHIRGLDIEQVECNGQFGLVTAALKYMTVPGGLRLKIRSDAPLGGGLGSSGAMSVALVGALSQYMDRGLRRCETADIAFEIERGIGVCCGKQDHYASVMGGINYMEFRCEEVAVSKLGLTCPTQLELESCLCLCYTGKLRSAGEILQNVVDAYFGGNSDTIEAIARLREVAFEMKETLLANDLQSFGKLLHENWQCQKRLHPSVSNSQIDHLFEIAYSNGAMGGKACGAGGGGCLVFFCGPDSSRLEEKLKEAGAQILDFSFDFSGLQP